MSEGTFGCVIRAWLPSPNGPALSFSTFVIEAVHIGQFSMSISVAQTFACGAAIALQGQQGVYAIAADTDGIDGVEDNAGALLTPDTLARAVALGLKASEFLDRNDAYNFFKPLGDLVVSGPTFTNVNDFRALLIL